MKAVLVHYHLKPGGVSTVIRRQLEACSRMEIQAFLIVGEEPSPPPGVPYEVVPELAYDPPGAEIPAADAVERGKVLAFRLESAASRLCGGRPDLYHFHNPTIRKNASLCPAVSDLAGAGARILAQAHDFAEDWRPDVLPIGLPYPAGCRWAVINGRDYRALKAAGIADSDLELLPNTISPGPPGSGDAGAVRGAAADLVLYPVRGIKRKNLGELLLLSVWLPPGLSAAVTLPPNNPKDLPLYEAWKSLARETSPRVVFEAGGAAPIDDLYARTRTVVTTSVKEGFGFSFLEPVYRGVPVAGRRLSSVVPDFEAEGISYPGLYQAVRVPTGFFDEESFGRRLDEALTATASAFVAALGGKPEWLDDRMTEVRAAALPASGADFGVLDAAAQAQVLERLRHDPEAPQEMEAANPFLPSWWDVPAPEPSDFAGLAAYSPDRGAERLKLAYERTVAGPGAGAPDRVALADALLKSEGFFCPGL